MTKKGPLSKAEKFYIESFREEQDLQALCKDLDRAQPIVKKHIDKCQKDTVSPMNISDQFARNGGSTIMTPNASEMADGMRGKVSSQDARKNKCITSIK